MLKEILSTQGVSHVIELLFTTAERYIVITTPYLKMSKQVQIRLEQADKKGINVVILYGKTDLNDTTLKAINSFENIDLYFLENLHAKFYFNEKYGLITSMNLYEFSQVHNWEIGIMVEHKKHRDLIDEFQIMLEYSEPKIQKRKFKEFITPTFFESLKIDIEKGFDNYDVKMEYDEIPLIVMKSKKTGYINIEIENDCDRIYFILDLPKSKLFDLKKKMNFDFLGKEYRIFHNQIDTLTVYKSYFHRDKWDNYSDRIKTKYVIFLIEKMTTYLESLCNSY